MSQAKSIALRIVLCFACVLLSFCGIRLAAPDAGDRGPSDSGALLAGGADAGPGDAGPMASGDGSSGTPIGGPCTGSEDCAPGASSGFCLTQSQAAEDGLSAPSGICTTLYCDPSNPTASCGSPAVCGSLGISKSSYCEAACQNTSACRNGYECVDGGCQPWPELIPDAGPFDAGAAPDAGSMDGGLCLAGGAPCSRTTDCCSGLCQDFQCAMGCASADGPCNNSSDCGCPGWSCVANICTVQCVASGGSCQNDSDCCGEICGGGTCL
jgi:hypothetical protein